MESTAIFFCLAVLLALAVPLGGSEVVRPKILPLDKITFNWPPPRQVGEQGFFRVSKEGKPACAIVVPTDPSRDEERSARLLKLYLRIVTGGEFEIKRELAEGPGIFIGNTEAGRRAPLELPDLKYEGMTLPNQHGFLVQTVDKDTLVIRGGTDTGTSFGVVSFIREYLGVQRYWPTEPGGIGDVWTAKPDLAIPRLTWRDWPCIASRHLGFNPKGWETSYEQEPPTLFGWYRMGFFLSMMHNLQEVITPSKLGKIHPEYFPVLNGKRWVPPLDGMVHWQLCVSNPEVVDLVAQTIIRDFDRHPSQICHALSLNDGSGDCECENCRAMDPPDADLGTRFHTTDRYMKFMNQVAEKVARKYPDKWIGFIAYCGTREPPVGVKMHPMLIPTYCAMGRELYSAWDEWVAYGAKNMGHYGYHDDRFFTLPRINPHQEARRIRFMVGSNTMRSYYKEFNPTYPLDAHAAAVCADLMWDPRLDEDRILAGYYDGMFAEVSPEMRAFYETLEEEYEAWQARTAPPHPYGPDRSDLDLDHDYEQFQVLSDEGAVKAWEWLLKAQAKATDPKVKQRVAEVVAVYSFVLPSVREYWRIQWLPKAKSAEQAERWAREALQFAREKAVLKDTVWERDPQKPWNPPFKRPYTQIKLGTLPPEVTAAVDLGFYAAHQANPRSPAWKRLAKDKDPVIAQSAQAVLALAKAETMENGMPDPGFEEGTLPLIHPVQHHVGSLTISEENPHEGKRCLLITDCREDFIQKSFPAKPGEKVWISMWVRANQFDGGGAINPRYYVGVAGKAPGAKPAEVLSFYRLPIKPESEWQLVRLPFTVPAGADSAVLIINAARQHAKAKLWIDDITLHRVPVAPLDLRVVPSVGRLGEWVMDDA